MPAKGSRAFTSLTPEDQWAMANGVSSPNGGGWKNQWNTNDIDNEFSMMGPSQQATLLQSMNQHRQRIYSQQQQYDNNQKSKAAADAAKAAADAAKAPTTPGGAPLPIPTVQERMTRMGAAVQKGIDKGSIGANQMQDKFKYQVPGTAPANPVANPVPVPMPKKNTLAGMTRLT